MTSFAPHTAAGVRLFVAALLGAILVALAYQIPANHHVNIGGYDGAYVQGFFDSSRADALTPPAYLEGSDGRARWTHASSFLLFPQIGLPAELTLRLRTAPNAPASQQITVLLNGAESLGEIIPAADWREYRYTINSGITKPSDVVIELRASQVAPISAEDSREVGVLLDQATLRTTAWPILPYPLQVAFGGVFGALAWALFERRSIGTTTKTSQKLADALLSRPVIVAQIVMAIVFMLLYRLQPLYPYPLRWLLPSLTAVLAGLVALRYAPVVARRIPALADIAAGLMSLAWLGTVVVGARQHLVLSVPGVEKDFRVFAARSAHLFGTFQPSGVYDASGDGVFRADGFYNLGYPFLLWLVRPWTFDNPFLAAQVVAIASGMVLLLATWWLARHLLGTGGALVALLCLACSPLVAQYALYVGTDMPFAAACAMAVALLITDDRRTTTDEQQAILAGRRDMWMLFAAGIVAGAAFLVRHPGIVLLPFGWLVILVTLWRQHVEARHIRRLLIIFTFGFVVAALPQLVINIRDTGNPLWSEQAKNIWLAAYANSDWANWPNAPNGISLADVVLSDPARFWGNWATNLRGFVGAGGEDVSEFGRADQLRLLAFPANWLAVAGLGLWLFRGGAALRLLLVMAALYVLGVTVGLSILRFTLPLVPVYALAAAWSTLALGRALRQWLERALPGTALAPRAPFAVGFLLVALIIGGPMIGMRFVLQNQPADEVAAVQLVQRNVAPNQRVRMQLDPRIQFDEYSAVSHLAPQPDEQATFVLRPTGETNAGETPVANAGGFQLLRIQP